MKKALCILVLFAVVLQTTASGIIFIQFELNRSYIAKNLCVKKEEKGNCCQGSCHLKKQLTEAENKEKSPVSPNIKIPSLLLFCQSDQRTGILPAPFAADLFSPYFFSKKSSPFFAVFHPPTR
jgi:hypothetical protein